MNVIHSLGQGYKADSEKQKAVFLVMIEYCVIWSLKHCSEHHDLLDCRSIFNAKNPGLSCSQIILLWKILESDQNEFKANLLFLFCFSVRIKQCWLRERLRVPFDVVSPDGSRKSRLGPKRTRSRKSRDLPRRISGRGREVEGRFRSGNPLLWITIVKCWQLFS